MNDSRPCERPGCERSWCGLFAHDLSAGWHNVRLCAIDFRSRYAARCFRCDERYRPDRPASTRPWTGDTLLCQTCADEIAANIAQLDQQDRARISCPWCDGRGTAMAEVVDEHERDVWLWRCRAGHQWHSEMMS